MRRRVLPSPPRNARVPNTSEVTAVVVPGRDVALRSGIWFHLAHACVPRAVLSLGTSPLSGAWRFMYVQRSAARSVVPCFLLLLLLLFFISFVFPSVYRSKSAAARASDVCRRVQSAVRVSSPFLKYVWARPFRVICLRYLPHRVSVCVNYWNQLCRARENRIRRSVWNGKLARTSPREW